MADSEEGAIGDHVLAILYSTMTKYGGELGVSLLVGGAWISGILCSPRSWFEQAAHLINEGTDDGFGIVFQELGRGIYPTGDEVEAGVATAPVPDRVVGYLHLRAAYSLSTSGRMPSDERGLLRIRIDHVAGWMLGTLGEPGYSPSPPPV